jgi:hypothetical protein
MSSTDDTPRREKQVQAAKGTRHAARREALRQVTRPTKMSAARVTITGMGMRTGATNAAGGRGHGQRHTDA